VDEHKTAWHRDGNQPILGCHSFLSQNDATSNHNNREQFGQVAGSYIDENHALLWLLPSHVLMPAAPFRKVCKVHLLMCILSSTHKPEDIQIDQIVERLYATFFLAVRGFVLSEESI
jgi:alpha-amylase/alpha-mannosidase (GH57 family)